MNINLRTYFTQNIPEIIQKMGETNLSVGSAHLVQVTHINHPHSFYVRISTLRYSVKLLEARGPPVKFSDLGLGQIVVYRSPTIGKFIRGRIQKIDVCERGQGVVCCLYGIDYGCVDTHIVMQLIFLATEESQNCGPLALHCKLSTCEPLGKTFNEESLHALKFFVGHYTAKIFIKYKTPEMLSVELRTVESRDDVATMLALGNFTSFFAEAAPPVIVKPDYQYKHRALKPGDKLHVRVQSGSTIFGFYVAEVLQYRNFNNVVEWFKFTKYCMNQPAADVYGAAADGRACGVKVLNPLRYERAYVKRVTVPGQKAVVQLLDWGNEMEANFADIKAVSDFVDRPAMAMYCAADRLQCLNYGMGFRMVYPGLEFLLEILENGNGFRIPHRVKLYPLFPVARPVLTDDEDEDDDEVDE